MKNPLAYLKHIVKDPIRTIPEANARKKEIMPLLFVSIGLTVVATVLNLLLELGFLMIFILLGIVGIGLCAFLFMIINKAKAKFAALTCDGCNAMLDLKTREDFDRYVTYEVLGENAKSNLSHGASTDGVVSLVKVTGESSASIQVRFTCPNCGKTKTFKYNITPFKCEREQKRVLVKDLELVKANLEASMNTVMEKYDSDERSKIPYSIQSIHHPDYENRTKPQTHRPAYNGVSIVYHREIDEMVEGLFIRNELNGNIVAQK